MTITSNEDFAKHMMLLAGSSEQYQPTAIYDADGDCIEFLAKPDPFYAERIDDRVTVYYSQETGEIIGSLIKGVSSYCRGLFDRMPGFQIEIQDGPVCLRHIFLARLWSGDIGSEKMTILTYRKLVEVSKNTVVEGEFCLS